mgnify:CR=1 FL=1
MRKNLQYKVLVAVMALTAVNYALPVNTMAGTVDDEYNYFVESDGETVSGSYKNVYGNGHSFTITGGEIHNAVYGVGNENYTGDASGGNVSIIDSNLLNYNGANIEVYGGRSYSDIAHHNTVNISGDVNISSNNSKLTGVYGGHSDYSGIAHHNTVNISGGSVSYVYGGYSYSGQNHHNTINISGGSVTDYVCGGDSYSGEAYYNTVNISGGSVEGYVYGGQSEKTGNAKNNKIIISGSANIENADLYGSNYSSDYGNTGNALTINGWKGNTGNGDCTIKRLYNFESINFNNLINLAENTDFTVTDTVNNVGDVNINSIGAGDYRSGTSKNIKLTLDNNKLDPNKITITGDYDTNNYYTSERVNADGLFINKYSKISVEKDANNTNTVTISAKVEKSALAGTFIDTDGTVYKNSNGTPFDDSDDTTSLTIGNGFTANTDVVAGAYAAGSQTATGGIINISGTTNWEGTVFAGYSESGSVTNNIINVAAGTKQDISLNGGNQNASNNTLNIEGNGSTFNSIANFETINFNNVALNNDTALSLINANLSGTTINVNSIAGGNNFKSGDTVTLIESESAIKGTADGITLANEIITAGVAQDLTVSAGQSGDNKIDLTITDVKLNSQTDLAAQTRAASAAFVNQGTDLISDSLDTISRDDNYGVKTFAAVHGNRSKYDVADDIKINGWSTIVGVGNADKFDNGSEFSWGVFYENGSGNYRTYNSFNNEFFRGDGSMVYNGGGIAARYENKNSVYTEGSLRAGMLKNELDNAMRNVNGSYGYETESAYYGAHIGVGKIISLSDSSDLDIYGKFFHTYTEGDSVTIAGDKFDFDSITSDRLRVGARITSNKENKFSTYYGLAYEYEFNGDADMTAQGLRADTQSLQGSSVMAEVGFNYQPTLDSPWSFDLNMRGYTGERQGGSFNVQATYTF